MPSPVNLPAVPAPAPGQNWFQNLQQLVNRLGEQRAYTVVSPVTGFSQQIPPATGLLLLTPAGTLATGTVTMPTAASDGFEQHILTSQSVTALTVSPGSGQTIVGSTAFTLTAGVEVVYRFVAASSTWYKMR